MFCPYKNSYMQLVCNMEPKVINKAVRRAMRRRQFDPHEEPPAAQRLESMQPSLFGPCVDVTRARLGYGRVGLRIVNREIHSDDSLIKLQAIHTLLDQVQISENAMFLINLNVVYRLIHLMMDHDPIVREKVPLILTHLANYYQGRQRMLSQPVIIDRLSFLFMRDRKEVRYAAALCLKTLTRDRCACEVIMQNNKIIENLLKMITNDHMGIMILHLNSLRNLAEWDPTKPLKANAFQVMLRLIREPEDRIVAAAMDCMTQLCKHSVGMKLADKYDLTYFLLPYLTSEDTQVIISAMGLMNYTTITTKSKWRAKEFVMDITEVLAALCALHTIPVLQLRAMQVLINLCDCPDIRAHVKSHWLKVIVRDIKIRTHEQWDGTSETTTYGLETGHNYRTMCIEPVETIKNEYGDNPKAVTVHSYLWRVRRAKERLIKVINLKPYVTPCKNERGEIIGFI